jgi:hypothetical protein
VDDFLGPDDAVTSVYRHDLADPDLGGDVLLLRAETEGYVDLATRGDGALVWVERDGTAHVVDPVTGEGRERFDVGGPIRDVSYDVTGTWLLVVTDHGGLHWFGDGRSGTIDGRFTAAAFLPDGASPASPAAFPTTAVAGTWAGPFVVIDTATGDIVRQLDDRYSDLDHPPAEGTPWYVDDIALTPGGATAWADQCCEPAGGRIDRYRTDGSEPAELVANAYNPSVSPDGRLVAYGVYTFGLGFWDGEQQRVIEGLPDDGSFFEDTAWLDDRTVVYARVSPDASTPRSELRVHALADDSLRDDRVVVTLDESIAALVTRRDGSIVWFDGDGTGHVVDPASGDQTATFEVGGPVADAAYDASGTWLLVVGEDGTLRWFGAGRSGTVPGRYTAAAW